MRQIFSSLRLETVEGVAALLNEHGIETRITEGRSYKGGRRRAFSYRDNAKEQPPQAAVWIVKSSDQPRARELLREAGLMNSTRDDSYLSQPLDESPAPPRSRNPAARIRLILLAAVVILAVLGNARSCSNKTRPATAPPASESADETPARHIVPVDVSLD